jgi:hypothetical protein
MPVPDNLPSSGGTGGIVRAVSRGGSPNVWTAVSLIDVGGQAGPESFVTSGNPLPVSVSTGVTISGGTIAATQSGAWTVGQSGGWTVAATQSGVWNVGQSGTWNVVASGTVAATQSGAWTVGQSGAWTVSANIGTTGGLALDSTVSKLNVGQGAALGTNTGPMVMGSVTTAAPTYVTGQISPLSLDTSGNLRVVLSPSGTMTVTGTVTANIGTTGGLALDASLSGIFNELNGILVGQNSATVGSVGILCQCAATTAVPSYTNGTTNPLSMDTTGRLRVLAGQQGTYTVSGTVTANQGGTWTVTQSGAWTVAATQSGAPWAENITQFGGAAVVTGLGTSGAGIPRMTVSNDSQIKQWDGTTGITFKPALIPPAAGDTAEVVTMSPNSGLPRIIQRVNGITGAPGKNLVIAFSSNNTAGNTLIGVVGVGNWASTSWTITITDTALNTWAVDVFQVQGTTLYAAIFRCTNCAGGANTVTIAISGANSANCAMAAELYELAGLLAPAASIDTSSSGSSAGSLTPSVTPFQASQPNDYMFAAISAAGGTITPNSPWGMPAGTIAPTGGGLVSFGALNYPGASPGGITALLANLSPSNAWASASACYKAPVRSIGGTVLANCQASADVIEIAGTTYAVQRSFANATASGENTVLSAVPGKIIRVISYSVGPVSAAVNVFFDDPTTGAISSTKYLSAFTGYGRAMNVYGHFETAVGQALRINLSGTANVGVDFAYITR